MDQICALHKALTQNAFYKHLLLAAELVWIYLGEDKANT